LKYDQVAVDASFLLKIFLPEDKSDEAEMLWKVWVGDHVEIMAPTLIMFEVSSVIRNKVFRGNLTEKEGEEITHLLKQLDISLIYTEELLDIAWEIGTILKTPNLYDCFYLALPKLLRIPLWTADKKLFQSAKKEFPFVNLL
jgi:predicted nucleic acid-binding protein